ncbi:hypothetical protein HBB16_05815 [Pseudonocardia sp. MCCB 268]|nr:hypothetical protein [Pseudonocardia cytotoxica]
MHDAARGGACRPWWWGLRGRPAPRPGLRGRPAPRADRACAAGPPAGRRRHNSRPVGSRLAVGGALIPAPASPVPRPVVFRPGRARCRVAPQRPARSSRAGPDRTGWLKRKWRRRRRTALRAGGGGAAVAPEAASRPRHASGAVSARSTPAGLCVPAGTAQVWPVRPCCSPPRCMPRSFGAPAADTVVTQDTGRAADLRAPARRAGRAGRDRLCGGGGGCAAALVVLAGVDRRAQRRADDAGHPVPAPVAGPASGGGAEPPRWRSRPAVPASAPTRAAITAPGRAGTADATVTARSRDRGSRA